MEQHVHSKYRHYFTMAETQHSTPYYDLFMRHLRQLEVTVSVIYLPVVDEVGH